MDCQNKLKQLLREADALRDASFSGLGIIIWDCVTPLPTVSMREHQPVIPDPVTSRDLLALANLASTHHDGFHVLDSEMRLIRASVYFSPPIPIGAKHVALSLDRGGRYFAAVFGSQLPGVILTGVLSANYGSHVFSQGWEVQC